tara:strand:+ start:226 stop:960 length:735 start_codon:yes stop_codon:yes gene_type:complete
MIGIEKNSELLKLVEGKTIAIVGPAPYLKQKGRGLEFDSHDLIARPNEIIPPKMIREDYGNRTDLFFCNFGTYWMPGIKRKILKNDNEEHFKKVKLVIGSAIKAKHSDFDYLSWPDNYISDVPRNFHSINKYNLPFYWIGVRDYKKLYSLANAELNTGIASILILLNYPIKKITVAGFTFYHGGQKYDELYCEGHMDEIDTKGRSFGHGGRANTQQIKLLKNLLSHYGDKIEIDETMKKILKEY